MTASTQPDVRMRRRYVVAAAVALIITVIFSTVGDGVEVSAAVGLRAGVIDFGHSLVWGLLTCSFSIAALHGRWTRLAQVFAVLAGVAYTVFLFAVFLWP